MMVTTSFFNNSICFQKSKNTCKDYIVIDSKMCFSTSFQQDKSASFKKNPSTAILPGLSDDVAKYCLALVPRSHFPSMASVCSKWRSYIRSKEFIIVRKLAAVLEEWLYVLAMDADGKNKHWEVLDSFGRKRMVFKGMPGLKNTGFGVVVLNGKLLVLAGYDMDYGALSDVYQYDSCINSWSKLASMNVARYEFACAELNGLVYVVGGYGNSGESLSSVESYDPDADRWTAIEGLRRPLSGCFACGLRGCLYVMGGRSTFTIGNSRIVDVYDLETATWREMKNGRAMVTAHAAVGRRLFVMEWRDQRRVCMFDAEDDSWRVVGLPVAMGGGVRFGTMGGKLLVFAGDEGTLEYDAEAAEGCQWRRCDVRVDGGCLCCLTIEV